MSQEEQMQDKQWLRIVSGKTEVIDFIAKADQTYQLAQRERIVLSLLAQYDALAARGLSQALELPLIELLYPWLKRPLERQLAHNAGRTQATHYFSYLQRLRSLDLSAPATLNRIEPQRLVALVIEDLQHYLKFAISIIYQRVGAEICTNQVKRPPEKLIECGEVRLEGSNRRRRYWAVS